jgi:hypothetical protein
LSDPRDQGQLPLDAIRKPRGTTVWKLEAALQPTSTHRKPGRGAFQSRKDFARDPAPGSHHPLIGSPVVEADLMLGHQTLFESDNGS